MTTRTKHEHVFKYADDIPGIGVCECGAVKIWNRHKYKYEIRKAD